MNTIYIFLIISICQVVGQIRTFLKKKDFYFEKKIARRFEVLELPHEFIHASKFVPFYIFQIVGWS